MYKQDRVQKDKVQNTYVQTCTFYIYCTGHKDTQTYRQTDIQADRQKDTERQMGRQQANRQ